MSSSAPSGSPFGASGSSLSCGGAVAVCVAALYGALAVAFGASAAHGPAEPARGWLTTAAQYQMVHALAMLAAVLLRERLAGAARRLAGGAIVAFALGVLLFCGALAALAFGVGLGPLRIVVPPAGGLLLIAGWLALAGAGLTALGSRR
jgi:uncharacterized membrane protein YgdD (TMEM256/DUF423 family)